MKKITIFESISLDGVMQAPGRPDEDRRGGFQHGGWAAPYADRVSASMASQGNAQDGALLFGRRTYMDFYAVWPNAPQPNPFTEILNNTQKYVVSNTLQEPLPWQNSTLLKGDAAVSVARLKQQAGPDMLILGSGELVQALMRAGLIDEFILLIHPLILGAGRRLFADDGAYAALRLVDSKVSTTGVVIASYQKAAS